MTAPLCARCRQRPQRLIGNQYRSYCKECHALANRESYQRKKAQSLSPMPSPIVEVPPVTKIPKLSRRERRQLIHERLLLAIKRRQSRLESIA